MHSHLSALLLFLVVWDRYALAAPVGDSITSHLAHLPIRRDVGQASPTYPSRHAARYEQHEAQKRNYERNMLDAYHVAQHDEVMVTAARMGAAKKRAMEGLGERAPSDAHSQAMADWYNSGVDVLYTIPTLVGTPQQGINVVPDTGSADFWVPWSESNMAENHETFYPSNSSTFTETNGTFSLTYGLGRAEGVIVRDTVRTAGFEVSNMVFGVATKVDRQFQLQANDGIMGFASSRISKYPSRTFFENLIVAKAIREPYFSVSLVRAREVAKERKGIAEGSEMCFGCMALPSNGRTTGDLHMVPLTEFAFWQVAQDSILLNGKAIAGTACEVIMDTGTTMIYLPADVADAMLAPIGAKRLEDGTYVAPAANVKWSTRFAFSYGGQAFEMNPMDLVQAFTLDIVESNTQDESRQTLVLSVVAANITGVKGEPIGIIGDAFLKNVVSVYHYSYDGTPAVGLQQIAVEYNGDPNGPGAGSGSAAPAPSAPVSSHSAAPRPSGQIGQTGGAGASASLTQSVAATAVPTFGAGPGGAVVSGSNDGNGAARASGAASPASPSRAAGERVVVRGAGVGMGAAVFGLLVAAL